jgi:Mn-dependent DtxR family transcriptional regulator
MVLTTAGELLARNITHRHQLLTDFLKLLGLDDEVIYHDVEGMEHHISAPTLRAIEALTAQMQKQPALLKRVKDELEAARNSP